ncbi:glycosyltransferase family 4 protein [Polaribacter sp. IC066]|uniref:glycosyltransferase family 4 protein n=1 Tax=Polaribacter sp. IC066 TaxID=57032 RepID=UPI0011BF6D7A|nr:glycosyltransferase family 4 protein [Polaribacter sp. IC066]TXD56683.1 glycosyltransferase family 4 protein [Polaribacter sp. IC066]
MYKKKICFVVAAPFTVQVFLKNHIRELGKLYDIYLVANFDGFDNSNFSELPIKEFKHIPIVRDIKLNRDIKALFLLKKYFKQMKFDVVHSVTPKAGLLSVFAGQLAKKNIRIHIFTGQVWYTKKGLFKKMLMMLDCFIVWYATDILVDGEAQRQFLIKNKIIKEDNSFVLGKGSISGVDTKRFLPSEIVKNEVRLELGIKESEVVFMFLGRMNRDKGIVELAEAFNRLQLENLNICLLLVGGDEENMNAIVKKRVKNIESVIFYGVTKEPEKMLQACDVFCLPSYREGFGTSILEASLLEKPVICSDTYGLMETIIENKTGLRHKVADADSLFFQMEKLVKNKELRKELGKGGRDYVLLNFSAETISEKWLEFYKTKLDV